MTAILWVILGFIVLLVLAVVFVIVWIVKGQNNLVHAEELVANSLSQIGVQQASRWDALSALADMAKQYSDQEYHTLMDTIAARQGVTGKTEAKDVDQQEALISGAVGRVSALAEAYPELKSNTVYIKTMDGVRQYEDNVRMSRMVYNDSVTKYNRLVRSLPGSLLAGSLGFGTREYLQEDASKAGMPELVK